MRGIRPHDSGIAFGLLLLLTLAAPSAHAATTFDLTADWSDLANPNGPWALREGSNLLPHVSAWQGLAGDFTSAQPAWARFSVGTSNLPCFFKSSATVGITHDWQDGDVVCHTTDALNGIGSGDANVTWTSPLDGTVEVQGAIWMGRDIGRGNHWSLALNGAELTAGNIASGDAYSRATPMDFTAGSGGAGALAAIHVAVGDVIQLTLTRTATPGDYAAFRIQVTLVAPSGVGPGAEVGALRLEPPSPNPLHGSGRVRFTLARACDIDLALYDVAGHRVASLASGPHLAGEQSVPWNPAVPSGLYFLRLSVPGASMVRRLALLR